MKISKTIGFYLLIIIFPLTSVGQTPEKMSYQAVIRGSNSELISASTVGVKITVLQGSVGGITVYSETHTALTNVNGLLSLEIGDGTIVSGAFESIDWGNGPYFLKTETDPDGGANYTLTGTTQLLSIPYALHAKTAEAVTGSTEGFVHYVGELFGGGIIVYVFKDYLGIEHGLILSLIDFGTAVSWGANAVNVSNAESRWNGSANTNAILANGGLLTDAAGLCSASNAGGQTDWYLPSLSELELVAHQFYLINKVLSSAPGAQEIAISPYWSSSEDTVSTNYALGWNFWASNTYYNPKNTPEHVRGMRSF